MPALRLDFCQPARPRPWPGIALLALGLAAAGYQVADYLRITAATQEWEARAAQLEHAQRRPHGGYRKIALNPGETLALQREVRQANQVLAQLAWPWEALFRGVEAAGSEQVALLAIEPNLEKRTLLIRGEARDLHGLLAYLRRLERQPLFTRLALQSHQIQVLDRDRPVRFAAQATLGAPP